MDKGRRPQPGLMCAGHKLEMREEHGSRPDSLNGLVAGRIQTSRGWPLAPRSLLSESPRRIFPQVRYPSTPSADRRCCLVIDLFTITLLR